MRARGRNVNRRIAGSGRWMGVGAAGGGVDRPAGLSRSVTSIGQIRPQLLQIKTNQPGLPEHLNL